MWSSKDDLTKLRNEGKTNVFLPVETDREAKLNKYRQWVELNIDLFGLYWLQRPILNSLFPDLRWEGFTLFICLGYFKQFLRSFVYCMLLKKPKSIHEYLFHFSGVWNSKDDLTKLRNEGKTKVFLPVVTDREAKLNKYRHCFKHLTLNIEHGPFLELSCCTFLAFIVCKGQF